VKKRHRKRGGRGVFVRIHHFTLSLWGIVCRLILYSLE
jgi:hypothetical protein